MKIDIEGDKTRCENSVRTSRTVQPYLKLPDIIFSYLKKESVRRYPECVDSFEGRDIVRKLKNNAFNFQKQSFQPG